MKRLGTVILMATLVACQSGFTGKIKRENRKILGQTAPSDMIFIKGNDSIPSFYIGVCEEPNINYITYLSWLATVYGSDYPKQVINALPHKDDGSQVTGLNDPFITNYLSNPVYAYYPVVNLDFGQIQKYLAWKTDRLNEAILIKNAYLKLNPNQVNEDNFVSECYFNNQYAGLYRHPDICGGSDPERALFSDGTFFTGFRLPTEKEWEHVNQSAYLNTKIKRVNSLKSNRRGFGKSYFLNIFTNYLLKYRDVEGGRYNIGNYSMALHNFKPSLNGFETASYKTNKTDSGFVSIMNYKSNSYGVINMEGGVKELLLDEYSDTINYKDNWLQIMKQGRFQTENAVLRDKDGYELEKDSLGHMNYRFISVDVNGEPIPIGRELIGTPLNRVVKGGTFDSPGNNRTLQSDTSASTKVGFRCILPYLGSPVRKGEKVKW